MPINKDDPMYDAKRPLELARGMLTPGVMSPTAPESVNTTAKTYNTGLERTPTYNSFIDVKDTAGELLALLSKGIMKVNPQAGVTNPETGLKEPVIKSPTEGMEPVQRASKIAGSAGSAILFLVPGVGVATKGVQEVLTSMISSTSAPEKIMKSYIKLRNAAEITVEKNIKTLFPEVKNPTLVAALTVSLANVIPEALLVKLGIQKVHVNVPKDTIPGIRKHPAGVNILTPELESMEALKLLEATKEAGDFFNTLEMKSKLKPMLEHNFEIQRMPQAGSPYAPQYPKYGAGKHAGVSYSSSEGTLWDEVVERVANKDHPEWQGLGSFTTSKEMFENYLTSKFQENPMLKQMFTIDPDQLDAAERGLFMGKAAYEKYLAGKEGNISSLLNTLYELDDVQRDLKKFYKIGSPEVEHMSNIVNLGVINALNAADDTQKLTKQYINTHNKLIASLDDWNEFQIRLKQDKPGAKELLLDLHQVPAAASDIKLMLDRSLTELGMKPRNPRIDTYQQLLYDKLKEKAKGVK